MSFSQNEISALCEKAARGAGFPARQAQLFGRAVVYHLASQGGQDAVAAALRSETDSPILRLPLLMDSVKRAVALGVEDMKLTLHPGDEELAPAYAALLPYEITRCDVMRSDQEQSRLALTVAPGQSQMSKPQRLTPDASLLNRLNELASRTYVPASTASRSGAGAGDIDND